MRVALLGPMRLDTDDGLTVPVGGARLRMLLARLALEPGRFIPAPTLVAGLWGEQPPSDAANALQSLVSRLRRTIREATGHADVVLSGPAGYQLAVNGDDVDVTRFERLAAEGRAHLRAGRPTQAEAALTEAVRLWQGTALAEVADAPFAPPVTARLAEQWLAAHEDRCEAMLALDRHADALAELDRLAAAHPLRERLVALRMRALAAVGRTADALADFQRTREALADELGIDPSAELRDAHLAVLQGSARPRGRPTLPAPLTSFVGRETDLADATALLAERRLVSLVGPGGCGKTRLAVELARDVRLVWFVELASVREGAGVAELAPAVLSALDLRVLDVQPGPVREPVDRLVEQFGGAPGLLVLDNCEHVLDGAAELAELLLRRCPALTVLATTREPLAITGEASLRVGPLDLPAEHADLAAAARTSSVRLFTDRAAAASPGFTLDDTTLRPVVEICCRLDGMPLALELAAARLRTMPLQQVADLLDDRFRLLTVGSRTSLPRHRTLRGVVEWSWELLTKPERTLARRLATLAGGADEQAACGVCADADLPAADVPYLLASLVDKSLLTVVAGPGDRPRYRMLETVRAYALEELAAAGEADRIGAAFVRYFTEFAERIEPVLRTREQLGAIAAMATEHDNVVAAIGKAVGLGDPRQAARLVAAMAWYWTVAGNGSEAATWARAVAAMPAVGPPTPATIGIKLAVLVGDHEGAVPRDEFERLLAEGRQVGLLEQYPVVGVMEAVVWLRQGDVEKATAAAVRMARHTDPWTESAGRLVLCFLAVHTADVEAAEENLHAALAGFRALGERWGTAFTLGLYGQYLMMRGDQAGAVRAHEEAVRIAGEVGAPNNLPPMQLIQLGAARGMAGDLDGAERDVLAGMATVDNEDLDVRLMGLCVLIHVAVTRGDLPRARALAAEADAVGGPDLRTPSPRSALDMAKATIALAADELEEASRYLADALATATTVADMAAAAGVGERIAVLVSRRGDDPRAAVLLGAAASIRGLLDQGEPNVRALVTRLTERLGDAAYRTAFQQGFDYDRTTAIGHLRDAVRQDQAGRP